MENNTPLTSFPCIQSDFLDYARSIGCVCKIRRDPALFTNVLHFLLFGV